MSFFQGLLIDAARRKSDAQLLDLYADAVAMADRPYLNHAALDSLVALGTVLCERAVTFPLTPVQHAAGGAS